jgi:type II secretory pathway component PulC
MAAISRSKTRWTRREVAMVLALIATCGSLAELVHAEIEAPLVAQPEARAMPGMAPATVAPAAVDSVVLRPLQAYAEVAARPVFSSKRRPPPPPEAVQPIATSDGLVLAGIVATASERLALVLHGQPLKIMRLKEGETVDGWTVRSILADRIIIETAASRRELWLREKSRPGVAAR